MSEKRKPFTRLEILLVASIASLCFLGAALAFKSSAAAGLTGSSTPKRVASSPAGRVIPSPKARMPEPGEAEFYLPKELRHLRFGVEVEEFKQLEPGLTYERSEGIRLHATKRCSGVEIFEITPYFKLEPPHLYYEMIVEFYTQKVRDEKADDLLGAPSFGKDWLITLSNGQGLHVWKAFETKLVYQILPNGPASVNDDLPTQEQAEEFRRTLEEFNETMRKQRKH